MASLDDLLLDVYGDSTQKQIAAENPYYVGRDVAKGVGGSLLSLIQKEPTRYKTSDIGLSTGIAGLVQGLFGGQGDRYQQTLTDRLTSFDPATTSTARDAGLPAPLFNLATRRNKVVEALRERAETEALAKQTATLDTHFGKKIIDDMFKDEKSQTEGASLLSDDLKPGWIALAKTFRDQNKAPVTDQQIELAANSPKRIRDEMSDQLKGIGTNVRAIARDEQTAADRNTDLRAKKVTGAIAGFTLGDKGLVPSDKEAQGIRELGGNLAALDATFEKVKGTSPWAVLGAEALVNKIGSATINASIQSMMRDQKTDAKQRELLRQITPASIVDGRVGQVLIDTMTGRDREDAVKIIQRVMEDAYQAKAENLQYIFPGKIYPTEYIRKYAAAVGATAQQLRDAGIEWGN